MSAAPLKASFAAICQARTTGDQTRRHLLCRSRRGARQQAAKRCLVLIIQADTFKRQSTNATIAAVIASDSALVAMPANVFLPAAVSGLPKDSVVNVTALVTLDKTDLEPPVGHLPRR